MTSAFHLFVIPGRRIGEPGISRSGPGASCLVRDFDATDKIPGAGDAGPGMTARGGTVGWVSGIHEEHGCYRKTLCG
jgi:hypothetical protein